MKIVDIGGRISNNYLVETNKVWVADGGTGKMNVNEISDVNYGA